MVSWGTLNHYVLSLWEQRRRIPAWNWSRLVEFANSRFLRTTFFWIALVPIATFVLSEITHRILPFQIFGATLNLRLGVPFHWKMFYFGAVAFGCGKVVCSIFCPDVIRLYRDVSHFIERGEGSRKLHDLLVPLVSGEYVWERNNGSVLTVGWVRAYAVRYSESNKTLFSPTVTNDWNNSRHRVLATIKLPYGPRSVKERFTDMRSIAEHSHFDARLIASILFLIGVTFITIVAVQNFYFVLTYIPAN